MTDMQIISKHSINIIKSGSRLTVEKKKQKRSMLRDTLVSDGSDDGQDIDEQVDYVQVEVESSEDVLLG